MVNTGKPSSGCDLCRKRKIKVNVRSFLQERLIRIPQCDEGRPGSLRCSKAGKPCSSYRDQSELRFRNTSFKFQKRFHEGSGLSDASPVSTRSNTPNTHASFDRSMSDHDEFLDSQNFKRSKQTVMNYIPSVNLKDMLVAKDMAHQIYEEVCPTFS